MVDGYLLIREEDQSSWYDKFLDFFQGTSIACIIPIHHCSGKEGPHALTTSWFWKEYSLKEKAQKQVIEFIKVWTSQKIFFSGKDLRENFNWILVIIASNLGN